MDGEKGILSRLVFSGEIQPVLDRKVTQTMFSDKEYKRLFEFIMLFYKEYGKIPSVELIESEFSTVQLSQTKEPVSYYIDKLMINHVRNKGSKILLDHAPLLVSKPLLGLEKLRSDIAQLSIDTDPTIDVDLTKNAKERLERYQKLKALDGAVDGLPTPWEILNRVTMGWHAGEFVAIVARPSIGKAAALDTLLWTKDGAIKMGDVTVGQKIYGRDGKLHKVTGVFPQGEKLSYKVVLSDGTSTECCIDHMWTVRNRRKEKFEELTLRDILARGLKDGDHAKWVLPMTLPVQFEKKKLLLDPYLLGCLLADGCLRSHIKFCNSEEDIVSKFIERLPDGAKISQVYMNREYAITGICKQLGALGIKGLRSFEKFIPKEYLFSVVEDRVALLQGLFDCDGYVSVNGSLQYSTSSERLADDIALLVESLGGTARRRTRIPKYSYKGKAKEGRPSYTLTICLPDSIVCFSSNKHKNRSQKQGRLVPHRNIVEVTPICKKPMQCIMVDAADSLYLTDHFIVTHNTWLLVVLAEYLWKQGERVLFVTNEMSTQQIEKRFDAAHFKLPYKEFRAGLLPDYLEKEYFDKIEKLQDGVPLVVVDNVGGVMSIGAKIDQYKPTVVLVDGMYLLDDDQKGDSKWDKTTNVSRDMKKLAKKKGVPVLTTTQFNRAADEAHVDRVTLANIGFADSIGQDADVVLGMFRTHDMESNNELLIRTLKVREGEPEDFMVTWDFHRMDFTQIGSATNDSKPLDLQNEGDIDY